MGAGPSRLSKQQYLPNANLYLTWGSIKLKARVTLPVASPTVGMRDAMEDTMAITPALLGENSAIFSVFDGHYGKRAAVYASKHLHDVIRDTKTDSKEIPQLLKESYEGFDRTLIEHCQNHGWKDGTTALTMLVTASEQGTPKAYVANAGDCRAILYVYSGDNEQFTEQITEDHSPDLKYEKKRIEAAGGRVVFGRIEERLSVSRGFGDIRFKQPKLLVSPTPDVFSFPITPDLKFVILASDGLWNWVSNEQASRIVRRGLRAGRPLNWICRDLALFAFNAGSSDNIAIIIVRFRFGMAGKGAADNVKVKICKEITAATNIEKEKGQKRKYASGSRKPKSAKKKQPKKLVGE